MNRSQLQQTEEHPPASLLLLHMDNELEGEEQQSLELHLSQCAACRDTCTRMQRGSALLGEFRDHAPLPQPSLTTAQLAAKLRLSPWQRFLSGLRVAIRIPSPYRLAFSLAAATIVLLLFVGVHLFQPSQSVYASQILEDARKAALSLESHSRTLRQKIILRHGSLSVERDVHHGQHPRQSTAEPAIDRSLQRSLERAHIDMSDPLSVEDFAAWRSSLPDKVDAVAETPMSITITSRSKDASPESESLTLARDSWRPIARSFTAPGDIPIEIEEESFEIVDSVPLLTASAAPESEPSVPHKDSTAEIVPRALELETAEFELREALFGLSAEVAAGTGVWQADRSILYRNPSVRDAEMDAIRVAAQRIHNVREGSASDARKAGVSLPSSSEILAGIRVADAPPPDKQVPQILFERYEHVAWKAYALDQLGKRYGTAYVHSLPAHLQTQIATLASSQLSQSQQSALDYLRVLSPELDAYAREHRRAIPTANEVPGCMHWQDNAAEAWTALHTLQDSFLRIGASPGDPGAQEQRIDESLQARAFLQQHLMATCQLF
jgi:hypothetical protein